MRSRRRARARMPRPERVGVTRRHFAGLVASAAIAGPSKALAQPRSRKPRLPAGRNPGGVPVAIIDSGIDYARPDIAGRLARDGEGDLVGWDLEDNDNRPLDRPLVPGQPPLGTLLATALLAEAGAATVVPVRRREGDGLSVARALSFVSQTPARFAVLPLAGDDPAPWQTFREAASQLQAVMVIAPAAMPGPAGRDLARSPSYPAALALPNVLIVTAVDGDGRLLDGAARGAGAIDLAVPAHDVIGLARDGTRQTVPSALAAVMRAAAMTARLLEREPHLRGAALKARILADARPLPDAGIARAGWIADARRRWWLE